MNIRSVATVVLMIALGMSIPGVSLLASDITIESASTQIDNGILKLNANAVLEFSDDAIAALESGIPLVFDLDIRIIEPRRLIWDHKLFSTQRRYSIERHALSRQFILTDLTTGDRRMHSSLSNAIDDLGRVRGLPILDFTELETWENCEIGIRLRLDIESLPAPMMPLAYLSPGWHMSSGWHKWQTAL